MSRVRWIGATQALTTVLAMTAVAQAAPVQTPWRAKVDATVLARVETGADPVEFLVVMQEQADLSAASTLGTKTERGRFVFDALREVAARTQSPLIAQLAAAGVEHRAFWITNMVWVRGDAATLEAVAGRPDVLRLDANPEVPFAAPTIETSPGGGDGFSSIEWGIQTTGANQVWTMGYTGEGVVVAGQDTGYQWDHPVLKNHYRGWNGTSADHAYNWHDSIHSGGGVCGADATAPCDDHNHGTHTMGTMVGDDGGSNQTGMAPDARWIGCRNMDQGNGTPATYSECFEWFLAPTDLAGQNPDTSRSPDVINNSWLCPDSEGCSFDTLQTVVENTRAAGIVVVVSAGNEGSGCSTVFNPPAIYDAAFSIGATDINDNIASFSSRGPVTIDGSNRPKPNVSAPGVNVRSSVRNNGYSSFNGTSMASPHVVGLVALLIDARPDLRGHVDTIETIIESSAVPRTSGQTCGGIPGSEIPNPVFGHGRIDAVEMLLGDADADGVSNLDDCRPVDPALAGAPSSVADLVLAKVDDSAELVWTAPAGSGNAPRYDVLRAGSADGFQSAICLGTSISTTATSDGDSPENVFFYIVRSKNECGTALAGDSDGSPRPARGCLSVDD